MSLKQYLIGAACFVLMAMAICFDVRRRKAIRLAINEQLATTLCPECSGQLNTWRGELTRNLYDPVCGSKVRRIVSVSCRDCGKHMDAFWYDDGVLKVQKTFKIIAADPSTPDRCGSLCS